MARILQILMLVLPQLAMAETINFDFGDQGLFTSKVVQLIAMFTVLSLAPSILVMATSFTRIVVVFSFLRTSLGLQQSPPNAVLISLALFLTGFIMAPVLEQAYINGVEPLMEERTTEQEAFPKIVAPFREFMTKQTRDKDAQLFVDIAGIPPEKVSHDGLPLHIIVPSFMISELRRAFEIGFLVFVPFLIIDMLVASILMAMGMMMLPPVTISLPFKIIFFVLIDGWYMICGSLVKSYGMVG
ncbi:MAG: flagellar type III secretion system pore protein FliP [Pseudomonadota bacterium]